MQDETLSQPLPLPRPRRGIGATVVVALLAFALGGALVGWLAHSGRLPYALPDLAAGPAARLPAGAASPAQSAATVPAAPGPAELGSVETRLALLEDRLGRIDGDARTAAGNAARAEALLIALAAPRRC
jgi:hypothetical protein